MRTNCLQPIWAAALALTTLVVSAATLRAQDATATNSAPPSAASQPAPQLAYGVPQILQLTQAKVGDDMIIAYIKNARSSYGLDPGQIIYLRQQGVSDAVLLAMLNQPKPGGTAPPPAQTAPPPPPVTFDNGVALPTTPAPPPVAYEATVPDAADDSAPYYYPPVYYYPPTYYYNPPVIYYFGRGGGWGGGWRGGVSGGISGGRQGREPGGGRPGGAPAGGGARGGSAGGRSGDHRR